MSVQQTAQNPQELPQTQQAAAEALGATLAEARKRLGLEQREVATRLGLNPVLVRRLEEGAFQELGAPVYARGYLTRYVRFLELPEQEILDRHKQLGGNEAPPLKVTRTFKPQARMSDRGVRWFSYLLIFAVIGWVGWQGYQQVTERWEGNDESPLLRPFSESDDDTVTQPQQANVDSAQSEPLAVPDRDTAATGSAQTVPSATAPSTPTTVSADSPSAVPATETAATKPAADSPAEDASVTSTEAAPLSSATSSQPDPAAPAAPATVTESALASPTATNPPSVAPAGPPQLSLEFTEDCWVEVKDANGERLAYGIMKADSVRTVSGPAPFSITLGNAVGVSAIKLNGNPLEPSRYRPERGTVIRFVVEPPQTPPQT